MSIPSGQNEQNLTHAYNQMVIRIQRCLEEANTGATPTLQKAINAAKARALYLAEITPDEAESIECYIKCDINDTAEYLMETSQYFSEWLMLDIEVVEKKVLALFFSVANKTRRELTQFSNSKVDAVVTPHHRLPPPAR